MKSNDTQSFTAQYEENLPNIDKEKLRQIDIDKEIQDSPELRRVVVIDDKFSPEIKVNSISSQIIGQETFDPYIEPDDKFIGSHKVHFL